MTNLGELRPATWEGGVPVVVGGQSIGAVGVSGLPEEEDIALARMGAALITD
jgi:glc operon protein GlcG